VDADRIIDQIRDAFAKAGTDTALLVAACRLAGSLVVDNRRTLAASDRSRIQKCLIAEATTARNRVQKDTWMKSGVAKAMGNALQAMVREDVTPEEKRQQSEDIQRIQRQISL